LLKSIHVHPPAYDYLAIGVDAGGGGGGGGGGMVPGGLGPTVGGPVDFAIPGGTADGDEADGEGF